MARLTPVAAVATPFLLVACSSPTLPVPTTPTPTSPPAPEVTPSRAVPIVPRLVLIKPASPPVVRLTGTQRRREMRYRVDHVDRIPKKTVPLADVFEREGAPRLVLITCGGAYDRGTGYRDNVVVTALPQSGRSQ